MRFAWLPSDPRGKSAHAIPKLVGGTRFHKNISFYITFLTESKFVGWGGEQDDGELSDLLGVGKRHFDLSLQLIKKHSSGHLHSIDSGMTPFGNWSCLGFSTWLG